MRNASLARSAVISAVVVSYRSAALARARSRAFASDAAAPASRSRSIAVVNSGDPEESRVLAASATASSSTRPESRFRGRAQRRHRNRARARSSSSRIPTSSFARGSLAALAAEARGRLVAAGPAFFLDEARRSTCLPPRSRTRSSSYAADSPRAERGGRCSGDVRRARRAAEAARAGQTRDGDALSGALVAVVAAGRSSASDLSTTATPSTTRRTTGSGGCARPGDGWPASAPRASSTGTTRAPGRSRAPPAGSRSPSAATSSRTFRAVAHARSRHSPRRLRRERPEPRRPSGTEFFPSTRRPRRSLSRRSRTSARFALDLHAAGGSWRPPEDVRRGFGGATWFARAVDVATGRVLAEGTLS